MKAVKFYGPGKVGVAEIPAPEPSDGEALVKILYGGICGSDLHIFREGMFVEKTGETMGHEFVGTVVSSPRGSGFSPADLVVGDPRVPCGRCPACAAGDFHRCSSLGFIGEVSPGAFADYLVIAPERLIKAKSGVDPREAVLAEPLAVAIHACRRIVRRGEDNALVLGAGPIGLLLVYLLKQVHAVNRVGVFDIDGFRLTKAREAGADILLEDLSRGGKPFSCVIDAVGAEAVLNGAIKAAAPGAYMFVSAIYEKPLRVDINTLVSKEITLAGNNAYGFEDLQEGVAMIGSGNHTLRWLVTSILPAGEAARAFTLLTRGEKRDLKILLSFGAS
jgi:2-desacetyl-2-hydroxyethyl bacteriochlorophyllide A dehydrogenase